MGLFPQYMQGAAFNPYGNNPQNIPNMANSLGGFLKTNAQRIGQGINGIAGLFGGGGFSAGGGSSNPLAQYGIGVFNMPGPPR
jgi:hypothetical protein